MTHGTSSVARQCCYFLWALVGIRIAMACFAMLVNWSSQSWDNNYLFTHASQVMFPHYSSFLGDNLMVSMAYPTIVSPDALKDRAAQWPARLQKFLYHNAYTSPYVLRPYHLPPLSTLQFMAGGWLVTKFHPVFVMMLQMASLFALIWGLMKHPLLNTIPPWIRWSIFATCYPALYAWLCGNLVSVLASLGVCAYILSILSQRWRYIGYIGLICAINFRPNIAVIMLLELLHCPLPCAAKRMGALTAAAACVLLASWAVAYAIDYNYTLINITNSLQVYHDMFVIGPIGMLNNNSLYGIAQLILYGLIHKITITDSLLNNLPLLWTTQLGYCVTGASIICAVLLCVTLYSIVKKRLSPMEACFLFLLLNALYTPAYAVYHMLAFVAILLPIIVQINIISLRPVWRYFLIFNFIGLIGLTTLWAFLIGMIISVIAVVHMSRIMPSITHFIGAITLLLLTPISPPQIQAVLMLTSVCLILVRAYKAASPAHISNQHLGTLST